MAIVISEIDGLDAGMTFSPMEITRSAQSLQQEAAKKAYDEAKARWDKVIPANPNAPTGPLPPPSYKSEIDTFFSTPQQAAAAAYEPPPPAKGEGLPTWVYVAGAGAAVVVLALLFWPTTRRVPAPAPAVAGLGCSRPRKRLRGR